MKLFKRIFTFAVMAIIGVVLLASCQIATGGKKVKIDMLARVYVSQSYELVAKDENGKVLSDVEWSISSGKSIAVIEDGQLKPVKAGVFTVTVKYGKETDSKEFSAVTPFTWNIEYTLNGGKSEELFASYTEFDEGKELPVPTRFGYTFAGWYENEEFEGEALVAVNGGTDGRNLELFAKWDLNVYDLEFDLAGGSAEGLPESYSIENPVASLPDASKEHYTFLGWYNEAGEKVEALGEANLGLTKLIAKYEAISYEINYELNGGEVKGNPETYTVEDEIVLVAPTKLGYKFAGWELNGEIVEKIALGTSGELQLAAKWEVVEYELSFELNGGAVEGLPTSYSIEALIESLPDAAKEHYTFLGWYDGDTKVEAITAENLGLTKLVAKYEAIKFEISYELNGGKVEGNPATYTIEDEVKLVAPEKAGYKFLGWELNGELVEVIAKGTTGALQLAAKWEVVEYALSFELNGGAAEGLPSSYSIEALIESLPAATKEHYEFLGWYDGEVKVEAITVENLGLTTLVAKWAPVKYAISYELDGGALDGAATTYTIEEEVKLATPEKAGHNFLGWELNGELVDVIAKGTTGDLVLTAKWELATYTVKFDYNDGSNYGKVVTLEEFTTELLAMFNRDGGSSTVTTKENFKATSHPQIKSVWNKAENLAPYKWLFEFAVEELTLAAKLNNVAELTYLNSTVEMLQKMAAGDTTAVGGDYADGRTIFRFWLEGLMNSKLVETGTSYYQNLMIDYSVEENQNRFIDAQGSDMPSEELKYGESLPVPTREHYTFLGWYQGENKVETVLGNMTVVAKWELTKYEINLDLNGGELEGVSLEAFTEALLAMFNRDGGSSTVTTAESFKATSHPQIKNVWSKAENLAAYKWFFEFAMEEITIAATANGKLEDEYYLNTMIMLKGMSECDTNAVNISDGGNARTVFRWWIEGLLNKKLPTNTILYNDLMIDYSDSANMDRFLAKLAEPYTKLQLTIEDKLPEMSREGYIFLGWFDGETKVTEVLGNANLQAHWEIIKFSIDYELNEGAWSEGQEPVVEFNYGDKVELLVPVKEGYTFLGWTQASKYVTEITNANYKLTAKWKQNDQTGFEVIFDLNGGQFEKNLDEFSEKLVAMFNKFGESSTLTTKENFKATSHPQIKTVWNKTENLEAYKWLFEFAIEELTLAAEANEVSELKYLNSTVEMLQKMAAGDTEAVGGSYADGRTIFRFWLEGLMNSKLVATGTSYYQNLMIDYSDPVNMARFVNVYCPLEATLEADEELPVAVREDYIFLGWYVNGEKVEHANGDDVLVAKWIHEDEYEWTVEFDLNGGAWAGKDLDTFAEQLVALFNSTGASDAKTTTREDFKAGSHPNIKYVWNKAENLTPYKWFFEFAIEEITAAATANDYTNNSYFTNTIELLEKMAAGDTEAVGGSYADGRTVFRWWIQSLINENLAPADDVYEKMMVDYSIAENMNRFLAVYAAMDTTYTAKDVLPTPVKADHLFLGWAHDGEIIKEVRGNWKLVAQWLDLANTEYKVTYDLAEGAWGETQGAESFKYNQFAELVAPVREGYKFVGWFENGKLVTEIKENRDYNLVAEWESESQEEEPEVIVYVGEGKDYASLNEAILNVAEGTTIVIEAGEHELSAIIAKSVKIVGPNAGLAALDQRAPEAVINVAKDIAGNLAAKEIIFDGVHLKGTGGGAGIPGVFFQDGGNIKYLEFKSCVVSDMNTFLKFVDTKSNLELVLQDCYFHTIGQFILWTTGSINKTLLVGNYVDGSTCGAVTNAAAALFRVRYGYLEAYNNTFNGDSANTPGYFECSADASKVMYNTFVGVTLFVHPTAKNNITFNNNLYLDFEGKPLSAAPSYVAGGGTIVKDEKVAASQEELDKLFKDYLITVYPDRYFKVEFDAASGNMTSEAPSIYDAETGIAVLPTVEKEGYIFLGWELNGEIVNAISAGTKGNLTLIAKWKEIALIVDGTTEDGHYATLADALAAAKDGDVIKLAAGEYLENVTINIPNLTIKGPNAGIDAVNGTREAEAIIKGVWTLTSAAKGIVVDGLSFTEGARIAYGENTAFVGFTFQNNKVYDTTEYAMDWSKYETRYELPGFIQFTLKSGGSVQNVYILNNSFVNVSEINVLANRAINMVVDGNLFKDFDVDAIRVEGGYAYGAFGFTNNVFEQTVAGNACQGIFLYSIAGSSDSNKAEVVIDSNEFINLGKDNGTVFTGAICAYRFQENLTTFTIVNNIFDHCYDYIYLRNNGGNSSNWFCTVENNQFLGLPVNQYFGSYRGSDTESTNPHLAVFTKNYYEDNEGKVITNLSAYENYFKHMASYGTALEAKPAAGSASRLEFWQISYDLNAGTTKGSFVYNYNSFNKAPIALPTLEKVNHQFNGWLLDGELVTEIPASARGNLHLVADFTVLEGEIYNIKFENEKVAAVWPSRAAADKEEIYAELFKDLYEWAQGNGETRSFDDYVTYIKGELAAYNDIKLRNTSLKNYPAEDGSTEYFLNIPKYFQKWNGFFTIFNEAMLKVNAEQNFYTDTYATMVRLHQFIAWTSTGQGYFNSYIGKFCAATNVPQEIPTSYRGGQVVVLPQLTMENGLEFLGWYDNPEFTGDPITSITSLDSGDKVFYAKWAPEIKAEKVELNTIEELLLFKTHQLEWSIAPENTTDKSVEFFSSDESVASVNAKGLITAHKLGKTTITMKVYGNRELDVVFDLVVYVNDYIDGSYVTTSHVEVGQTIQLLAEVVNKDGSDSKVLWTSKNPEIATVDSEGVVTAVAEGNAIIVATAENNPELKLEFQVSVLKGEGSEMFDFVLDSHESNIFTRYNLNIGSVYNMDILGSVSKLLMNYDFVVDTTRKDTEVTNATGDYFDPITSIEFITVHYTGNMAAGADAKANANYFVGDNEVSIHYTTGNDGIYQCLDHAQGGYHAGDSGAYAQVGPFEWIPTGVKVGENDPMYPEFTISDDFYYEINGQKTSVPMPKPWNYSGRNTDHVLNEDGTISSKEGFGQTAFTNRTPESFINDQSLPFKVVDGEYYMGTTWWAYTQVYEGRICSTGGNRNSLGIESCVNQGSDLWYTWQITAQLVARLMQETGLDITRVRGHHFYTAKNCPQPMLENDLEIWWEFLELVEAEYELLTKYSDYEIKFESHNPEIMDNHGRIIAQPDQTTSVSYTITITKDGVSESVTLSSMVKGLYVDR